MKLPSRVIVELTNKCNRKCQRCPRHKSTYPQGFMTETLYMRILKQLPDDAVIVPFFRGESLTHPLFPEFMEKLRRFKQVQFASNGDYLTKANQRAIQRSCSFFSLSLHEFKYPWNTVHSKFLRSIRKKGLKTQVSILETLVQADEKKRFVSSWQKTVDRVRIYKEHSIKGFGDMQDEPKPDEVCKRPFTELVAYWDGHVGLCCQDWNNRTPLGDLNLTSIQEVWRNQNYREVRRLHRNGERGKVASCADCCFRYKVYGELFEAK